MLSLCRFLTAGGGSPTVREDVDSVSTSSLTVGLPPYSDATLSDSPRDTRSLPLPVPYRVLNMRKLPRRAIFSAPAAWAAILNHCSIAYRNFRRGAGKFLA